MVTAIINKFCQRISLRKASVYLAILTIGMLHRLTISRADEVPVQ